MKTLHIRLLAVLFLAACSEGAADDSTTGQDSLQPAACAEPFQPLEGCEEAACEMARCGAPDSFLDSSLCKRKSCDSQDDCSPDEECRWLRYAEPSCYFLDEDGGFTEDGTGTCYCGSLLLDTNAQLCLPKQ